MYGISVESSVSFSFFSQPVARRMTLPVKVPDYRHEYMAAINKKTTSIFVISAYGIS
jgi:hypothetical protein